MPLSYLSIRPSARNNSAPNGQTLIDFDISVLSENLSRIFKSHQNLTSIRGTLHEDMCTCMMIPRLILVIMRNVLTKVVEKIKASILCSVTIFFENRAVCEIMWKNKVDPDRPQMTIQHSDAFPAG